MKTKLTRNAAPMLILALAFGLFFAAAGSPAPTQAVAADASPPFAGPRVGYVDIDAISDKADFAQELKKSVETEYDAKRAKYEADQAAYAALLDDIKATEAQLGDDAKDAKYRKALAIKAQLDEEQYAIDKFVKDSEKKKAPALDRIVAAAREVAKDEGFDVVLAKELLIYGRDSVDISDKVVARLNADAKAATAKPAK